MDEHHWRGRPLSELSRDELIEVINYLGSQLRSLNTPAAIHEQAVGRAALFARDANASRPRAPEPR